MATTQITGVQYSGIWTLQQAHDAISTGDWPTAFTSGYLYTWGGNPGAADGALGLGNTTQYSSPKQVGSSSWAKISARGNSVRAIFSTGGLYVWGENASGQLGLGNTTKYSSPKQVGALTNWTDVSSGTYHTLAVASGRLYAWGYNSRGDLGLGNRTNYSSPKQVGALTTWLKTAAGQYTSYAIKTDGTLWSWGRNDNYGQLGLGNTTDYSSPKQVGALTNWAAVKTSGYMVNGIKTDGTLWTWGNPANAGALGLGTQNTAYSSPMQVGALSTWATATCGGNERMFGINTAGNLYSWGSAPQGQLGHGNGNNYSSPKQVGSLSNWLGISAGQYTVVAFKTDGTLWSWGANHVGVLGLGNTTNYSSPKQIGSDTSWFGGDVGTDVAIGLRST